MVGRRATDALLVLLEVCFFLDTASGSKEEAQDTGYVGQDAVVANWRLRAGQVPMFRRACSLHIDARSGLNPVRTPLRLGSQMLHPL